MLTAQADIKKSQKERKRKAKAIYTSSSSDSTTGARFFPETPRLPETLLRLFVRLLFWWDFSSLSANSSLSGLQIEDK